jgi:hypothetical protein
LSVGDAEQILRRTKVFEFGGMPPKRQVQAFNLLLDQSDAQSRFERIAARGETAGKLYALSAFFALQTEKSAALAAALAENLEEVLVIDSDVVRGWQRPADVVILIRNRRLWERMRHDKRETAKYFDKAR